MALFLVHPEFTTAVQTRTGDFFGIPLTHITYTSSVIPIILIIWAQSYIERAINKILPKMIKGVFAPVLILMITGIVGVLLIGPIGTGLGNILGGVITWLNQFAGWLVSALLGGFGVFIIMAGGHYSLIPIATQNLAQVGFDNLMMTGLLPGNMAMAGAAFAIAMRTKSNGYKQYSISAAVTALLGVSQPALYGVAIPIKKAMTAIIIGGFIGGLYAGIVGVKGFALYDPGLAALPAYISPDGSWGNFINTLITMVIAFGMTFALTYFGSYEELSQEEIEEITVNQ